MVSILSRKFPFTRICIKNNVYLTTSAESVAINHVVQDFITHKSSPADHSLDDCGKFYTIPMNESMELFKYGGWPKPFMELCNTLRESSIMIRKQGLEIIHYLKNTDYSKPINKYVLYGKPGRGKSLILSYILHYAFVSGFLIVHVPWVPNWVHRPKEITDSETKEGCIDLNVNASEWLQQFKTQNSKMLQDNNLRLQNSYNWNVREVSEAGDSLLSLIDFGMKRGKLASDVLSVLLEEVKLLSKTGVIKTLVLIDGYNAIFHETKNLRNKNRNRKGPRDISFMKAVLDLTKSDWHNGAAVVTCDELALRKHNESELPLYQLTLKGYEFLFPFIPIEVTRYTDQEMMNQIRYYRDRRWLTSPGGDDELMALSDGNPYQLMKFVESL